ncbi:MAG: hypothetical protein HY913_07500 [Desulfomonile tiedjei]|nr:hypothetical protein [Desulfomonile tiedjei]
MRAGRGIMTATLFFILLCYQPVYSQNHDVGVIESMSEGDIYVRGNYGLHQLELLGTCLWCEVGLEVLVTFRGFTRATLRPSVKTPLAKPVGAFIIKDGREQAEMR